LSSAARTTIGVAPDGQTWRGDPEALGTNRLPPVAALAFGLAVVLLRRRDA
jgi:hypothetical protein